MRPNLLLNLALFLSVVFLSHHQLEAQEDFIYSNQMDLLELEMQSNVLAALQSRGFYVSPQRLSRQISLQEELTAKIQTTSGEELRRLENWTAENQNVRAAEKQEMLILARKWGEKMIAVAAGKHNEKTGESEGGVVSDFRLAQRKELDYLINRKKSAATLAQDVVKLAKKYQLAQEGKQFQEAAVALYRGTLKDGIALEKAIRQLDLQRMEVDATIKTLSRITRGVQTANAMLKAPSRHVEEQAERALSKYLEEQYPDKAPAEIASVVSRTKSILQAVTSSYEKAKKLERNPDLRQFPQTLRYAQNCTILTAVYKQALEVAKQSGALEPFGPVVDFLEFYVDGFSLVPTVAKKAAGLVGKFDQSALGARATSLWAEVYRSEESLWKTAVMRQFGIQVAATGVGKPGKGARYIFVVTDNEDPEFRSTEILNNQEFNRLCNTLADERITFARREASRTVTNAIWESVFGTADDTPISNFAAENYLADLKEKALNSPFTPKQLLALAQGKSISFRGNSWNASKFETRADGVIASLAVELTIRRATNEYRADSREKWNDFKDKLSRSNLSLSSAQILNLFAFHHSGKPELLDRYIQREKKRRKIQHQGKPMIGVPLVDRNFTEIDQANTKAVQTTVMVSHLARDRKVRAQITWLDSLGNQYRQNVTLKNGANVLSQNVHFPGKGKSEQSQPTPKFSLTVKSTILPDEINDEKVIATGEEHFEFKKEEVIAQEKRLPSRYINQILTASDLNSIRNLGWKAAVSESQLVDTTLSKGRIDRCVQSFFFQSKLGKKEETCGIVTLTLQRFHDKNQYKTAVPKQLAYIKGARNGHPQSYRSFFDFRALGLGDASGIAQNQPNSGTHNMQYHAFAMKNGWSILVVVNGHHSKSVEVSIPPGMRKTLAPFPHEAAKAIAQESIEKAFNNVMRLGQ